MFGYATDLGRARRARDLLDAFRSVRAGAANVSEKSSQAQGKKGG
jgi:hypothetical protein